MPGTVETSISCLKQSLKIQGVIPHWVGFLQYFCTKQERDFKSSAATLYPNIGQVTLLPTATDVCTLFQKLIYSAAWNTAWKEYMYSKNSFPHFLCVHLLFLNLKLFEIALEWPNFSSNINTFVTIDEQCLVFTLLRNMIDAHATSLGYLRRPRLCMLRNDMIWNRMGTSRGDILPRISGINTRFL